MRIAIIGAGVGGLAVAAALRQRGFEPEVYEAAPKLMAVGGGLLVPPNSARVLDRLGAGERLWSQAVPLERLVVRDVSGRVLQSLDQAQVLAAHGHPIHGVSRAALHRALAADLPPASFRFGKRAARVQHHFDGVSVGFEDGSEVTADVLIGADGANSRVRAAVLPEARLEYAGQTCLRGVATGVPSGADRDSWVETWGPGLRFGFVRIGPNETYWYAAMAAEEGVRIARRKATALHAYRGFGPQVLELVGNTAEANIHQVDLRDLPPLERWWRGRTVLLGDAAHATTPSLGQGAAQAVEDAEALAEVLASEPGREEAFTRFQELRQEKAQGVVSTSRTLGRVGQAGGVARWWRNLAYAVDPRGADRRVQRFYDDADALV